MKMRGLMMRGLWIAALIALGRAPSGAQGVPPVANPPASYPYPNVLDSAPPSSIDSSAVTAAPAPAPAGSAAASTDASPAADAAPAASGAPQADPTSQAPNTYGSGGAPPLLNISTQTRDDSPTMRIGGSYPARVYTVSLHALAQYRHDSLDVRNVHGEYVSYGGVALQFLPGVSRIVLPMAADSDSLVALARATITVIGRDGKRALFHSSELIDPYGNPRVFLVDRRMGVPLGPEGPFRIVSPHDTNESRWIRDVVEIDVNR